MPLSIVSTPLTSLPLGQPSGVSDHEVLLGMSHMSVGRDQSSVLVVCNVNPLLKCNQRRPHKVLLTHFACAKMGLRFIYRENFL